MDGIEILRAGEEVLAIIIRAEAEPEDNHFITPDYFVQQGRFVAAPAGGKIPQHDLVATPHEGVGNAETLHVRRGRVQVDLFFHEVLVATRYLKRGDCIMLARGAHSLKLLEDSVLFEISQGPFTRPGD